MPDRTATCRITIWQLWLAQLLHDTCKAQSQLGTALAQGNAYPRLIMPKHNQGHTGYTTRHYCDAVARDRSEELVFLTPAWLNGGCRDQIRLVRKCVSASLDAHDEIHPCRSVSWIVLCDMNQARQEFTDPAGALLEVPGMAPPANRPCVQDQLSWA